MTDIKENPNGKGRMRKMDGINAKNPEPGMEIKGKFGTYKLVGKIDGGGNGTVFSAEVISAEKQLPTRENFVIKILTVRPDSDREREKREKRFEKEVKYVSQMQNEIEGIIPIYDTSYFLEERGNFAWYLMPKASNYNFMRIRSTEEKLKAIRDLGDCIAQLHKKGIAHRDIKPKNLLVYKNKVCLSDFGLVWKIEESEENITDIHDNMGPIAIRPPEMQSIEYLNKIDYTKSDVYLFAKTVWIILTGETRGFSDEYIRSEKRVYLDKKKLRVETAEPLHEMLEAATRHYWWDRIDINACLRHIDDQLNIIAKTASDANLGKWIYDETVKEICKKILPDIQTYQDTITVLEVLERMAGTVNLVFEEAGKTYEPMLFKSVKIMPENLFKLDIRNYYGNRKVIVIEIEKISIKKDLSCIIDTKVIVNQPNDVPVFTNLNKALQSDVKQICISGIYGIRLVQTGLSFY